MESKSVSESDQSHNDELRKKLAELANQPEQDPDSSESRRLIASIAQQSSYSGPIPPPVLLKQYDELEPGRAARLLDWIEDQSRHRMSLEKMALGSEIARSWGGLVCGFIVALFTIGAGSYVAVSGHPTARATIATTAVGGLVASFIYGTMSRRAERIQKAQQLSRPPQSAQDTT